MTVCIAVVSDNSYDGDTAIILCTDWQTTSALGTAETHFKQRRLPKNWRCMTAGTDTDINALVQILRQEFNGQEKIDETNVCAIVRAAVQKRLKQKIDDFVQGLYAFTYDHLLDIGREKLPPDLYREAIAAISKIGLGAELIIAGFSEEKQPLIVQTTELGKVLLKEDFATIGEGAYLAQSVLLQRQHSDVNRRNEAVYSVYEAKKYAERVSSVGSYSTITIMSPEKSQYVSQIGKNFLQQQYELFGPKPYSPTPFPAGFLRDNAPTADQSTLEDSPS